MFARSKGHTRPLTAAELELMNFTGDGNGIDLVTMPQEMRAQVPTSNFFQRGGYERNPIARRTGVVSALYRGDRTQDGPRLAGRWRQGTGRGVLGHALSGIRLRARRLIPILRIRRRKQGNDIRGGEFAVRPPPDVIKAVVVLEDRILSELLSGDLKFVLYMNTFHHPLPDFLRSLIL